MTRWDTDWHARLNTELALLVHQPLDVQRATRRELGKDPVAFALIYLRKHIKDRTGRITFCDVHYEWARMAEGWRTPVAEPQADRHALVAPRDTGKSTWWFLILPLWAGAYGVKTFPVAFADTAAQAETHLRTFKAELEGNPLLAADFPELCTPARKQSGGTVADRAGMIRQKSSFVFAARGIDSSTLGLKVDDRRPDLLIFDDIEPDEKSYSADQMIKRRGTVTDAAFPLNIYASVIMVGTVTMPDSMMHQVVKAAQGRETADWIRDEKIQCHHYRPITQDPDGTERSIWEAKWPIAWLAGPFRKTRSYAKNYDNDPRGRDGGYWTSEDFTYGSLGPLATRWILVLDPAVTTKRTSDYTGWAVVACAPGPSPRVEVVAAGQVKLVGEPLRLFVLKLISQYPRIKALLVEVNQGGELWRTVLHSLPVQLLVHTSSQSKEIRFALALDYYQDPSGRVLHREELRELEEQMVAFPNAPHDDIADAAVSGALFFLRGSTIDTTAHSISYV